ncbi:hypothetical protein BDQ17DRAFT_1255332 [Cyathus striatus]|nr:hypothetical protein BDQ17DRAFT_1255332 [Cyathus striatus]
MDKKNFATNFELKQDDIGLDVLGFIDNNFLEGRDVIKCTRAEIHELNVYGKGSFMKKYNTKDKRKRENTFASLIITFPTPECEGGEFTFYGNDRSWTWDSVKALRHSKPGSVAYVAFYSDVDLDVSPVRKGHLITLTYHVYIQERDNTRPVDIPRGVMSNEEAFKTSLYNALKDPTFLPDGGYLGFALQCMYPIEQENSNLKHLLECLKGSDAMTRQVCEQFDLPVQLKAVYTDIEYGEDELQSDFAVDNVIDPFYLRYANEEKFLDEKGWRVCPVNGNGDVMGEQSGANNRPEDNFRAPVVWITKKKEFSMFKSMHHAEGWGDELYTVEGFICLMAKVGCNDSMQRTSVSFS